MFLAAGCGAYSAAIFHLVTHAFFKALLFLGAGAVILAMHHEQDIDKMGGLRQQIPRTHRCVPASACSRSRASRCSRASSRRTRSCSRPTWRTHVPGHAALYAIGARDGGAHRLLHVPALLPHVLRREPRRRARCTSTSTSRRQWILAPLGVLARALGRRRLPRPPAGLRRLVRRSADSQQPRELPGAGARAASDHAVAHATERGLAVGVGRGGGAWARCSPPGSTSWSPSCRRGSRRRSRGLHRLAREQVLRRRALRRADRAPARRALRARALPRRSTPG